MDTEKYYYWKKGENIKLSDNFYSAEFTCSCKNESCVDQQVSKELIEKLQWVRNVAQKSITITSGFRCAAKQKSLKESGVKTAVGKSSHELGEAADIHCPSIITAELCVIVDKIFNNVGVSRNFLHVDVRPLKADGSKRRWTY